MTTLPLIIQDLISSVEGNATDSSKFSQKHLIDLCDQFRSAAISQIYQTTKRISPSWQQTFIADFDESFQDDDCAVKFLVPAPIGMGAYQSGIIYTGTICGGKNFRRLLSQAEVANYMQHRNINKKAQRVLIGNIEGDYMLLKVFGNKMLKEIRVDGVFSKPTSLSTYNFEKDLFPLCDEGIALMKQLLIKSQLLMQSKVPSDLRQDQKPLIAVPAK